MRNLTNSEITTLIAAGNSAESWDSVWVAEDFVAQNIRNCRFEGRVELEGGVTLADSTISNYHICRGAKVLSTVRLECRKSSTFGNGVEVAAVNENGGRAVKMYSELTAQTAYIIAMYRHRQSLISAVEAQIAQRVEACRSSMGVVGEQSTVVGAKFVRETYIGKGVTIEGASLVQNATLLDGATVGVDVKAEDFIAVENSKIGCGAVLERCFVGENAIVSNGFTAIDSLIFASSHLENGEACSIFAGPYTVSHHKSSLLIAGIFSFFNAGSGTNQSNHLFKSGAIHQAVHRRGCKFGSNGYVMSPADNGEFSVVIGRHTKHHNTSDMPFSYLLESGGNSYLLPAFALRSYGTVRDIEKWQQRDKRSVCRDIISYNEYNPLLTYKAMKGIDALNALLERDGDVAELHYNGTIIKRRMAERGVAMYRQYVEAAVGAMLGCGCGEATSSDKWVDIAGQYIDRSYLEQELDNFSTIEQLEQRLHSFAENYDNAAHGWALAALAKMLGHIPSTEDIAAAISSGEQAHNALRRITDADHESDRSLTMSVGYGIDSVTDDEVVADFKAVHNM